MPKTRGKKKSEYEKQLEKTRKAVQKVKDTKYKAQLEKTAKAVKKVKDTKAVVKQVKKVKKAVQKVKDTKYKAQLEKTGKAVQKVKDTKYKAQLEKTAMAVKKVKDTKAALKPKKKAAPKKKFSDDVSDVKTKAPTIKKGTKISATFKEIKEKPKKAKAKFTSQENIEMAERENEDRRKKAAPKKEVTKEKMDRMKRKVAILNRKKVAERKLKGFKTQNTAKKLKAIDALPDVDPEAEMDAMFGKAKAKQKKKAKPKKEPSKVFTSVKLGGEGMDLPDLYKHGMGNASKIELGGMLDKMGKDINAEIKKMKTADRAYFKVVKVRGGTEYHTEAASIMNREQKEVQKELERYVETHGIRDSGVQEMIGKFNRLGKSAVNRMRKAKGTALERLGFI